MLNQQPTTLARVLTERLSDSGAGAGPVRTGRDAVAFSPPRARLSEVVVSTRDAALFVKEDCAVFPDAWALLRGTFAVRAVRLDEASLLVRQTPSAAAPKPFPLPSFTLPPALAGTDITLKNGLFALLRPGQSPAALRPVLLFSGLSGSGTLPDYETEGETLSGGSLHLAASSLSAAAETEEGAARRQVDNVRLDKRYRLHASPTGCPGLSAPAGRAFPARAPWRHAAACGAGRRSQDGKGKAYGGGGRCARRYADVSQTGFSRPRAGPLRGFLPGGRGRGRPGGGFQGRCAAGRTKTQPASAASDLPPEEKGSSPLLKGTLTVKNLSLPRWFDFARDLPSGVTAALDGLSGTLPFELTPRSLTIASARVTTLDTPFTGGGGVKDFRHPVIITVTLGTPTADLNRLFPELTDKAVAAPVYAMPPLLGGDDDPGSPAPGYDVRLTAARATCAYWGRQGRQPAHHARVHARGCVGASRHPLRFVVRRQRRSPEPSPATSSPSSSRPAASTPGTFLKPVKVRRPCAARWRLRPQ
ncbi:MAG: hypothetical protein V8Q84_10650 [Bilophila sp.]